METIESSEITVFPKDKLLYNDVLCDKVNSKLKKLHVQIRQTAATDGSKVYNLDIKGVRHKFHLQVNFAPQDLCFLRFDEFQENVQEPSCLACLNRNYYPNIVYSRLMFLLYSDPGDGGEAKCVKIPLLQRGNINAATSLLKLQKTIHDSVLSQDELKHWVVRVETFINFAPGEWVFLGITKYAVVIVQHFHILQYHTFYDSEISAKTSSDHKEIQITVKNKTDRDMSHVYLFHSVDWESIERTLQYVQRKSVVDLPKPNAHFNILHSEVSASGFVPGTTSDNVTILPHYHPFVNNNSSSGSNGYLHMPGTNRAIVHTEPQPHTSQQWSSSSNGHIPGSDSLWHDEPDETFARHSDIVRPSNISLIPEETDGPPTAHRLGSPGDTTDPCQMQANFPLPRSPSANGLQGMLDNPGFEPGPNDVDLIFIEEYVDDCDLPPPQPCSALPHPHGEFFAYKPPAPMPDPSDDMDPSLPLPHQRLLRSYSCSWSDSEFHEHLYVNTEQYQLLRNNVHDDSPYVRFYYNVGFVRCARMSKKLKRRQRLSKELSQVDMNKLENHEQWYDQCFKRREKDLRFCRLSRMNIETEDEELYSSVNTEISQPDDPYWNSSLCLTIQKMLQESPSNQRLSAEIQQAFDLTHEQLTAVQVLLSLVPSEKNWHNLAEYIGLTSSDVGIIEHYCYTYRELATTVVLYHWLLEYRQGKQQKTSSYENLHRFIENIERRDIKNVMDSGNVNRHLQRQQDNTIHILNSVNSDENVKKNNEQDDVFVSYGEENDELLHEECSTDL